MKRIVKNIISLTLKYLLTGKRLVNTYNLTFVLLLFVQLIISNNIYSQVGSCDASVPVYIVDLSNDASGVWSMPNVDRDGSCCSYAHPPGSCVKFILTLNSNARSIIFNVSDGALPSNLEWQLMDEAGNACDTTKYPADVPVCLNGVGPHTIVFCKPGGNNNTYTITSVPSTVSAVDSLFNGCDYTLDAGPDWATYFWNTGDTTQFITAQDSGWYWVETSSINCLSKRDSIYFAYQPQISLGNDTSICYGDSIILDMGTGYTHYVWSTGQQGDTLHSITVSGGTYSVTVTDNNSCTSTASIKILAGEGLDIGVSVHDVFCVNQSNGTIDLSVSGGFSPYSYAWSSGQTTEDVINLAQGTYNVTVTDGIGCAKDTSIVINDPVAISVTSVVQNLSCYEQSDGVIDITVSGGNSPYSFNWDNGETTEDISGLLTGYYTVTVSDANLCTYVFTDTVTRPSSVLSAYILENPVNCKGGTDGSTDITVTGGTVPYSYNWSNGQTTENISGLSAGNYQLTVTDDKNCVTTTNVDITEPADNILISSTHQEPRCNGDYDGSIDLIISGGTPEYSFIWDTGQNSEDLQGISAGTYNVTVTDINDCTIITSIVLGEPGILSISSIITDVDCYGNPSGSIDVNVLGGVPDYTYFWTGGITDEDLINVQADTYDLTVTDSHYCNLKTSIEINTPTELISQIYALNVSCKGGNNGSIDLTPSGGTSPYTFLWSTGATSEDINNLPVGIYSVTITDANGCSAFNSVTVTEPASNLQVSIAGTDLLCNGGGTGQANTTVIGGTQPYTYLWSNGYTNSDLTGLDAGTYEVTVTDKNGCTDVESVVISEASGIIATANVNSSTCGNSDGSVSVSVSGGSSPYTYLWSNGETVNSLTNIKAGAYTLTITDDNNCEEVITVNVNDINAPIISILNTSNVTCYNSTDGVATISVSGGATPYTYAWSNGDTDTQISGVGGGTYNVTVVDHNGCVVTESVDIDEPEQLTSIIVKTNVLCNGGSTGSINLIVNGGTSPYTYLWNNGSTNEDLINISSGSYTVTITDANSCIITNSTTITQPAIALAINNIDIDNVSCNGDANGVIDITVIGGTQPYGYQWSSGQVSADIQNLLAGTYIITVTDANHCTKSETVVVNEPALLAASIVGTDVSCKGGTDGATTLTVTGGTPAYSYIWNFGQATQNLTNIGAGVYEVTVTDTKPCIATASVIISEPSEVLTLTITKSNVRCNGDSNGSANLEVRGGTPPYTYNWSSGQTTQDLSNVAAGTYSVTVTDAHNCTAISSVTITEPSLISATITPASVSCHGGADGEIALTVSGGTVPYSYQWNLGQTSEDLTSLTAGTYTVTITDAKLCNTSYSATVTEPSEILLTYSVTNVSCLNGTDGSIDLSANGGTGVYNYIWNTGATSQDISNVANGIYEVTVTDNNSCSINAAITIYEPSDALTITLTGSNLKCRNGNDGEIDLIATGGTQPYTYLWSNSSTQEDLTGLDIGSYSVTVTDANSCIATSSVTLTEPASELLLSISGTDILCNGASTGDADLTAVGGVAPYSYSWSNSTITEDLSNVQAGTYSVSVTDANECLKTTNITLTQPTAISVSTSSLTDANCTSIDGSASISVSGGTSPYTYLWSNGSVTNSISNVVSGGYTVTVTDDNACEEEYSVNISDVGGPDIAISYSHDVTCNGDADGKATVYVVNGLAPFTYAWTGGSTTITQDNLSGGYQTVTVTDVNGCITTETVYIEEPDAIIITNYTPNICDATDLGIIDLTVTGGVPNYSYVWSNGATSQDVINLPSGTYTVTVTDVNGCQETESVDVTVPAIVLSASIVGTDVQCKNGSDGSANLTVNGGTPGYSYTWNFGQTVEDIGNLSAGTYEVTVTDAISCQVTTSVTIVEPTALSTSISKTNLLCNGDNTGSLNITVSGGTLPYSYSWSNAQTTEDISGLAAASYTVTITDAHSCSVTASATISEPTALSASLLGTDVKCNGGTSGSVQVVASGGTPLYSYLWSNAGTQSVQSNLTAGTYTVTVKDANNCQYVNSVTISQPSAITSSIASSNVNCYGGADGSISLTVAGGTPPDYAYIWNYGQTESTLTGISAGNYQVTITDVNLCSKYDSVTITQPASTLTASLAATNVSCDGGSNGSIILTPSGGTTPYTYQWSNGASTQNVNGLNAATYTVTLSDVNGCYAISSSTVTEPSAISIAETTTNVKCSGGSDGSISLSVSGGTPSYSYAWSTGATTATVSNLTNGTYTVTVTDHKLCTEQKSIVVTQPVAINILIDSTNIECHGDYGGEIDLTVSGGTPSYSYLWNTGSTQQDLQSLSGGVYEVTVTDDNDCVATADIVIEEPDELSIIKIVKNVSCYGNASGSIVLIASGGETPYSYVWNTGATTDSLTSLSAGLYQYTVTDNNNCTKTGSATITQPAGGLSITSTKNNVSCFGGSDAYIALNVSGGVLAYSYSWASGETSSNLLNISAGTYTVTVTDANLCTSTTSVTITQPSPLSSTVDPIDVACFGDITGQADLEVTGGTSPYSYSWSNGQTGLDDLNGVASGTYIVTVTDSKLCQLFDTVQISQPAAALQNVISGTNVSCYGFSNGSAMVSSIGGTPPYSYLWNYAQTTSLISNIAAGSYSVTVTDSLSCKTISTITITQPNALSANITITSVNCNGGSTGGANLTVTGGTQPYSYSWSNFTSNEDISNVPAGNYQVTITDDKLCSLVKYTTVTEPALLQATIVGDDVNCYGGSSGVADLTTIGGTPPYSYLWSSGQTNPDISSLVAGSYSVTVTDFKNCVSSANVTINEPAAPIEITYTSVNASCYSSSTGSININVSGGTTPYTYSWNYGQATQDLNSISAANYSVTVTDSNSCIETQDVTITQPTELTGTIIESKVKCKGENTGALDLTPSGGVTPYTYNWSNGQTTQDISNLFAGLYAVTITDANGCTKILSKNVTEPAGFLTAVINPANVSCYNGNNGAANLTVSGGTQPYSYLWSNGLTSEDLLNVAEGTYDITVTDVNSCITSASVTLTQPTPLFLIPSQTNSTCGVADGSASISVSGGTPGYTYLWSNGGNSSSIINVSSGVYTVTVTDANSCTDNISIAVNDEGAPIASITGLQDVTCNGMNDGWATVTATGGTGAYVYEWSNGISTTTASNLSGGIYYASVTDDNNCLSIASVSIYEPDQLHGTISPVNVKCKGNSTGAANLTVSGGTNPYSFTWSSGQLSEDISNIPAGFYTVTVTDLNGCQTNSTGVVTEPAQVLSASASKTDALCNGSSDGTIDLTVSGGTPAYSYLWNYGQVSQDLSNIEAGFYEVTVTDNNACKTTASVIVNQATEINASIVVTNSTCNDAFNGAADLTVSGGTLPYTYSWSNGANTQDLSNVDGGNYEVTITDSHSCSLVETATIAEPTGLAYTITGQNVKCYGESTGSIALTVSGGTMPYTYLWNSGQTNEDLSNIPAGVYQVLITDAKGCTANAMHSITQPFAALATSISGVDVNCYDGSDGSVDLTVGGGTTPYTYQWNYGQITQDLSNIPSGTYEVTVTDANNCTASNSQVIIEPTEMILVPSQTSSTCGIANGVAQITVSGGVAPYTYLWNNFKISPVIDSLMANTYSVTVTDANGCSEQVTISVSDQNAPSANLTYSNVSCYGAADGEISLSLSGGTSPFTYAWSNTHTVANISNLSGGEYTVTITDANNCIATASADIFEPEELMLSATNIDVMCKNESDGEINLTVVGGTPNFTYNWSNIQHTQDLTGLSGGTYTVTVIDANICFKTLSVTIDEPIDTLNSSILAYNVSCYGMTNGVANLSVSGGTPNYSYQWNQGATTEDISNLGAGNYEVTITDANGCIKTSSVTITQPAILSSTETVSDVNCKNGNDGSAMINISGGTTPYTYFWSNGNITNNPQSLEADDYLVTVTDAKNCKLYSSVTIEEPDAELSLLSLGTNVNCYGDSTGKINLTVSGGTPVYTYQWIGGQTTEDLSNIPAGTYSITVIDANSCQASLQNISITQPSQALSISFDSQDVNCYGDYTGAINLSVSGGTPTYQYVWNSGQINQDLSNIAAGDYSVTVTDNKNCRISGDIIVSQPSNLVASIAKTNVSCYGESDGNINLTVSGGVTPYSYAWNYGQSTEDITLADAGFYSVTITDDNSCIEVMSAVVNEPQPIQVSYNESDVSCKGGNDGFIDLNISGGTPNYNFNWSGGDNTEDLSDIEAGTYTVTISDKNFCTETETITINEPSTSINVVINSTNVSCNGEDDGIATAIVTGGTGPYEYHWNFGNNTQSISNLVEGLYEVTVNDEHNCIDTASVNIIEPASLVLHPAKTNSTCGQSNGTASVTVTGGTSPYSYIWSTGEISSSIINKPAGAYAVTVTDAHLCSNFIIININDLGAPASEISNYTNPSCFGYSNGTATVSAIGGTGNYSYHWSNGGSQVTTSNLLDGIYTVTVSDENNCASSSTVIIEHPDSISLSFEVSNVKCYGACDGSINMTVSGGTPNYFYQWNYGQITQDLINVCSGEYEITVTDNKGCTATSSVQVNQPQQTINVTESHVNVSCYGFSDGSINISVNGGTQPYTYLWNLGQTTQDINNIESEIYEITVTDANSCTATKMINVTQPTEIQISAVVENVSCNNINDGNVNITITGGTPTYTYEWSNGDSFEDISGLAEGDYTLTVTDFAGCVKTKTVSISQPDSLIANINFEDVKCKSGNDGTASVIVSGGTPEYSFNWSTGASTEDVTGLSTGTYNVTISDDNGCETIASVEIGEPAVSLTISYSQSNVSCYGGYDGYIDINVTGGTPNYSYVWNYGQTSQDITGLNARAYQVTVTDANLCTATENIVITQPAQITITPSTDKSTCNDSTGMATATAVGGTGAYTYLWSTGSTNDTIINIPAEAYSLTITDENSCTQSITINVNDLGTPTLSTTYDDVTCNGDANGWIDLLLSGGGNPPYSYNWSNNDTTEDISGLSGGNYAVTVTDINGCKAFINRDIYEPDVLESEIVSTDVKCNGGSDGTINLSVTGGTGAGSYSFNWDNNVISEDLFNISAGTYNVTITDTHNCTNTNSVEILQPENPLTITETHENITCFGYSNGSINISVTGGTPNYTYLWNYGQTSQDLNNLAPYTYELTVTDELGCTEVETIEITQPQSINIAYIPSHVNCKGGNNGEIDVTVSGGTSPYNYLWTYGETTEDIDSLEADIYSITVTDVNLCTANTSVTITEPIAPLYSQISGTHVSCKGWNDGSTYINIAGGTTPYNYTWNIVAPNQNSINNLYAGTYSVSVIDAQGCEVENQFTVTEPDSLLLSTTHIDVNCYESDDASINLSVIGGTQPYLYSWTPGNITQDLSGIGNGIYGVTVTDAHLCSASTYVTITQPDELQSTLTTQNVKCFGDNDGSINLSVTGGIPEYTYAWNYGQTTEDLSNLAAGNYVVTITDEHGCELYSSVNVTEPEALNVVADITDVSCNGKLDGDIVLSVSGGTPNYSYAWSTGILSRDLMNVKEGTYSVHISDINGCSIDTSYTINQPDTLQAYVLASMDANYNGNCDGYLTIGVNGGTPSYTYTWTNGMTGATQAALCAGNYYINVTDANGCITTVYHQIGLLAPPPHASFTMSEDGCPPLTVHFMNTSYFADSYLWDFGDGNTDTVQTPVHVYQNSGVYIITLTAYGESGEDDTYGVVTVYPEPSAHFTVEPSNVTVDEKPIHCYNNTIGATTYLWDFGDGNISTEVEPIHYYDEEGIYDVYLEAYTENGCVDSMRIEDAVNVTSSCLMVFPDAFIPNKDGAIGGNWENEDYYSNRIFHPVSRKIAEYRLEIYTRWGEKIFESEDVMIGWDGYYKGRLSQQDVYVYKAWWKCENGKEFVKTGDVTLYH